jgi:hypothetical protein
VQLTDELTKELECCICCDTIAFPVNVSGCKCESGNNVCYYCWHHYNTSDDGSEKKTCIICHQPVSSFMRNQAVESMADKIMEQKKKDSDDRIHYEKQKLKGQQLWQV